MLEDRIGKLEVVLFVGSLLFRVGYVLVYGIENIKIGRDFIYVVFLRR